MGLDEVLSDLEGEGYAARPFIVPACAADAPHRRDRVWIIARNVAHAESLHSDGSGEHSQQSERQVPELGDSRGENNVADTDGTHQQRGRISSRVQTQHNLSHSDSSYGRQRLWPTPTASDNRDRGHKGMPAIKRRMEKGKQLNLSMVVSETSGSLNPQWVEWLMGYPEGWTDLED